MLPKPKSKPEIAMVYACQPRNRIPKTIDAQFLPAKEFVMPKENDRPLEKNPSPSFPASPKRRAGKKRSVQESVCGKLLTPYFTEKPSHAPKGSAAKEADPALVAAIEKRLC